jgi:hypothetical protein
MESGNLNLNGYVRQIKLLIYLCKLSVKSYRAQCDYMTKYRFHYDLQLLFGNVFVAR